MCPQGHPHQLGPILLKHFPMVLQAKAKRKARGKAAKKHKNQIVRTHARKIWIKVDDAIVWCLFVSSLKRHTFPYILHAYILQSNSTKLPKVPTPAPLPHDPTLIKYRWKGWTNKIILLPGPMWCNPCPICHTSILDTWTIGCIGNLLAENWWPSILTSPRFSELTVKLHHSGWPVTVN